ncbi:growth hormone secretagogue receptor type 1 [Lingula anatina]|uniref:Growth hormone secretagogue receptor type 1 n=1 Tax=Lingula anatina TaxID=7574 RepID=A0A1S3HT11_LINAN|nr:growth hormone secretagogue receptor type 1 [Lingula anatina]XP_023930542.1 growth hormone secretagogue receptor type 1 [Lingula anatina]XP_023930543.1 growth hormone secretagogue receptor type 1 [Lingula anatina]|eukprot:XP_013389158.2 growth hormone secretagogue receptor type 1 [Lingula anatina]
MTRLGLSRACALVCIFIFQQVGDCVETTGANAVLSFKPLIVRHAEQTRLGIKPLFEKTKRSAANGGHAVNISGATRLNQVLDKTLQSQDMTNNGNDSAPNCSSPQYLDDSSEDFIHFRAVIRVMLYSIGIVCNMLSVAVFHRKSLRRNTTCLYMTAVAVTDTLVLLDGYMFLFEHDIGINVISHGAATCKLTMFILYCTPEMSGLFLTIMSAERYVKIKFPFKAQSLCTVRNTRIVLCSVALAVIIINSPIILTGLAFEEMPGCERHICWNFLHYDSRAAQRMGKDVAYFANIHSWLGATLYWIIPLISLPVINIAIIYETRKATKRHAHASSTALRINHVSVTQDTMTGTSSSTDHDDTGISETGIPQNANTSQYEVRKKSQKQVQRMLLVVTFSYVALVTPYNLLQTRVLDLWKYGRVHQWVFTIAIFLFYANHAVNFWLYCISAPKYRRELRRVLKSCRLPSRVESRTTE